MEEKYLIAGLKNNDRIAFDYIFNYYYSGLCAYSLKYITDKSAVEDIVQDFFVSLWVKRDQLDINISIKSYLFTAVKNRCLDYLKHNHVKEKFNIHSVSQLNAAENSDYNLYVETELRMALNAALQKLPPRCREIFELSRFKGLKNNEIAEKLNISRRTVEIQISLALKTMRGELKDFLPAWLIIWLLR